jgi:hypothetical protein
MPTEDDVTVKVKAADTDAINDVIGTLPAVVEESKKGYKTSEFWLAIATSVLVLLNGIPMPEQYEGFVIAALGAVYALSRGIAKKGVPHVEVAKAETVEVKKP